MMHSVGKWAGLLSVIALLSSCSSVDAFGKKVKRVKAGRTHNEHDQVHIVVNKVGPFNNPTETYRYYSLPFCSSHATHEEEDEAAEKINHDLDGTHRIAQKKKGGLRHKQRIGESIVGDRRETSPYEITYDDSVEWRLLCKTLLSPKDITAFKEAIHNNYFFEMFVEDLPMWGYLGDTAEEDIILGEVEGSKTFLFPHLHFYLGTNDKKIVAAKVTTDLERKVDITDASRPIEVQFSYSVEWYDEPELNWKDRMTRYSDSRFLPSSFEIHWLSIINSFVLVLLLTAFLTVIMLRVLKNDFSRYMDLDDEAMEEEESGWKLIHGDVFRFPQNTAVFCAAVGTGQQLLVVTFCHLVLALTGLISTNRRGSMLAGAIILYCMLSFVGSYLSVRLFQQMNGKNWVHCTIITAALFPVPCIAVFMWVNSIALAHGSTSAFPFTAILTCIALMAFVAAPLTIMGGIMAKNYAVRDFNAPTRTTKVAREIPTEVPWFKSRPFQMCIAGFLPFSAIYIELYYIFASMWGHQIYTLFGILMLAFILLVIVVSFITVALLYFQLAREDHRWWWASFLHGGMSGLLLYFYSFYYYFHRSGMSGILQSSFYFGYMAIVSFAFFLMLGSAGFQSSLVFTKYIYGRIKCD
mmetsp:Transcript_7532/g.11385  ORF Transcript_7532/g.11385 Transcript_7532/m.11385 type:complete len:636 (+) Transcript_7532:64-1971(+)|eukprot:CAMPEP_0195281068 /NCGR_PEP_ID=MMETSP0707-20130614/531_1 /TAXON_ID=33640 /ORGANISM="Asterionellopsis glacialis, Strain CCMP134" /LENGTH=635 /DNA_ID=CAMNT_0040339913 /DNA_START=49 /DNA_END=1956 /DNA_ORIENTATION=-